MEVFSWVASARREVVRESCSASFWERAACGVVVVVVVVVAMGAVGRWGKRCLRVGLDVAVVVAVGVVVDDEWSWWWSLLRNVFDGDGSSGCIGVGDVGILSVS